MPAWMWPLRQRVQRQVMVTRVPGRTCVPGTGPRTGDGPAYRGRARVPGTGQALAPWEMYFKSVRLPVTVGPWSGPRIPAAF